MSNAFDKKLMVVSAWAPGDSGASPLFFYNLFSRFNPDSYVILTNEDSARMRAESGRLQCRHVSFGKKNTSFFEKVMRGLTCIRTDNIEMLLGIADKGPALLLTFVLSLISGKPYGLYFLDLYRWNDFGVIRNIFARMFEPVLFSRASVIFVMGEGHKRLYEKKYGNRFSFTVIRNCPDPADITPSPQKTPVAPYRIIYTGNVYWAQEKSIQNLIKAVRNMPDLDIRIELYAPRGLERMKKEQRENPRVFFGGTLTHAESKRVQREADILFLPLSWDAPSQEVIEMATPGKTAEYLASGRPILVHAPPWSYLARYAKEKRFASVVDTEHISSLEKAVRDILNDSQLRESLTAHAFSVFKEEYDVAKNAETFLTHLNAL